LFPSLLILASAGVSPNIFVAAQAGIADMKVMSPPVDALGIGFMGKEMPTMPLTVYIAHLVYGGILGWLCHCWIRNEGWLLAD